MTTSSPSLVSIPSIALARMAMELACQRARQGSAREWLYTASNGVCPAPRAWGGPASQEYYRIIDAISRGERP